MGAGGSGRCPRCAAGLFPPGRLSEAGDPQRATCSRPGASRPHGPQTWPPQRSCGHQGQEQSHRERGGPPAGRAGGPSPCASARSSSHRGPWWPFAGAALNPPPAPPTVLAPPYRPRPLSRAGQDGHAHPTSPPTVPATPPPATPRPRRPRPSPKHYSGTVTLHSGRFGGILAVPATLAPLGCGSGNIRTARPSDPAGQFVLQHDTFPVRAAVSTARDAPRALPGPPAARPCAMKRSLALECATAPGSQAPRLQGPPCP